MSHIPHASGESPLLAYHARTKHRFEAYAQGPGQLDWDAQPAAFRHYLGAPVLELPLAEDHFERPFGDLGKKPAGDIAAGLDSVGALLELSFGVSAWKSWGPSRCALRCNPSSGNLHPVEAYVLCAGLPGIPDGLHHYDPEHHVLEGRALCPGSGGGWLAIGLSSAMWREAWKYGERAFRYCQLDVGHALGALGYASALLGWRGTPAAMAHGTLAHCLGLDREEDFPPSRYAFTEAEEPEILVAVQAPGLTESPSAAALSEWLASAHWQGRPTAIDPSPGYRWPIVDQAAAASRPQEGGTLASALAGAALPGLASHPTSAGTIQLIRQRRSAQRFDPCCTLPKAAFYRILDALLPRSQMSFRLQESPSAIHLLLFVLRVDGLPTGLYLLTRGPEESTDGCGEPGLAQGFTDRRRVAEFDAECPAHLGLVQLAELDLWEIQRLARALSCHQDIAATSAFSLGMLGDLSATAGEGYAYRQLLRQAGLLGQILYLEAEAAGVRGTGIGCFFDDPVHQTFGITGGRWQSVYHFTVGTPVIDTRIETSLPYPPRQKEKP